MFKKILLACLAATLTGCCTQQNLDFTPSIEYFPQPGALTKLPSAFGKQNISDATPLWEKELYLGLQFAKEFDFYRAITCYKRSFFLAPQNAYQKIEYHIIEAYYLAKKYGDAIEFYEGSYLKSHQCNFPSLHELLLILYDCYLKIGQCERAERILFLIQEKNPDAVHPLNTYSTIFSADFCGLDVLACQDASIQNFLCDYNSGALSESKARLYNAILPGWGYFYVGQKKAAITSFTINALFTIAAIQFFQRGYTALGAITLSLEAGWYFGGINGAGLAAKTWNETLYSVKAKEYLISQKRFPILMFDYVF